MIPEDTYEWSLSSSQCLGPSLLMNDLRVLVHSLLLTKNGKLQKCGNSKAYQLTLFLTGCLAGPFVVLSTIFVLSSIRTKRAWQTKSFSPRLGKKFMGLQRPIFGITLILAPIPAKKCVLQRQTESNHFFFLLPLSQPHPLVFLD